MPRAKNTDEEPGPGQGKGGGPKKPGTPVIPVPKQQRTYAKRLVDKARGKIKKPLAVDQAQIAPKTNGLTGKRTSTRQIAAGPDDPKYTEITPIVITGFLAALATTGMPTVVAREQRIHYLSLRALYREDEAFRKDWDHAMVLAFEHHEDEVRRRAFQGYEKKVFQQGMLVGTQTEYSDTLAVMMIKAGKPETYNPKTTQLIEHAGSVAVAYAHMSDEQLNEAINEKLRFLGSLPLHTGVAAADQEPGGEVKADDALDLEELNRSAGRISGDD